MTSASRQKASPERAAVGGERLGLEPDQRDVGAAFAHADGRRGADAAGARR